MNSYRHASGEGSSVADVVYLAHFIPFFRYMITLCRNIKHITIGTRNDSQTPLYKGENVSGKWQNKTCYSLGKLTRHTVFTPRQKAEGVLLWACLLVRWSVGLLTPQCFRTTGRISWWIITIFGLWVVVGWAMRKTKRFFEIHIFRVKNGKISNRNCAFLAKSVFSQYRVHFFMDHHDFWFVSCW